MGAELYERARLAVPVAVLDDESDEIMARTSAAVAYAADRRDGTDR
jgi:hypothetical protein